MRSTYWVGAYHLFARSPFRERGGLQLWEARALERRWERQGEGQGVFCQVLRQAPDGRLYQIGRRRGIRLPMVGGGVVEAVPLAPILTQQEPKQQQS